MCYLCSMKKQVIIVGASSGIGRELALLFLQKGWRVGLAARREKCLEEIRTQYPSQVEYESIDIDKPECTEHFQRLIERVGGMSLYLHVAGIGKQNIELKPEIEESTVQTNGLGFVRMVGYAFRYLSTHGGGHIAAISSIAGTKGLGVAPSYSATKAMQGNYLQALDQLAKMQKIPVVITDIRPGFVDTPLLQDSPTSGAQSVTSTNGAQGYYYPMLMNAQKVAMKVVRAIEKKRRVVVIDCRYTVLTFFWRLIPNWLWVRLPIRTKQK